MTKIEWTHRPGTTGESWNPIRARNRQTGGVGHFCVHASDGCKNCYAERFQPRFKNPVRYAAQDRGKVALFLDEKTLTQPLHWRKPRTIFVCSMTDLFLEDHPDAWIDRIKAVQALTPQHTYIELTKRAERQRDYTLDRARDPVRLTLIVDRQVEIVGEAAYFRRQKRYDGYRTGVEWPLPNLWSGVSAERQAEADERIPQLLATPAAVRFVSLEPLLGPVDLTAIRRTGADGYMRPLDDRFRTLDWVIAGGESGPGARPMHPDWPREIRDKCQAAGVPFFFKQWGEWAPVDKWSPGPPFTAELAIMADGSQVSHDAVPQDVGGQRFRRIGKKRAGDLLDGREWHEFPEARP